MSATAAVKETGPLLSVMMPVFNEVRTVCDVVQRVLASPYEKELVIVDDGSTDGTAEAISNLRSRISDSDGAGGPTGSITVLRHETNLGKGAAILTAFRAVRGQFVLIQDADLEYDPRDYRQLVEPLLAGQADVVYGSRYLNGRLLTFGRFIPQLGTSLLNRFVCQLYGVNLSDIYTCYKVFPVSHLASMHLQCRGFEFCPEVTAKACRMGLRILEVPISYKPRGQEEGKKIRWRDGVAAMRELWKWRKWTPAAEPSGASLAARPQAAATGLTASPPAIPNARGQPR